MINWKVRIKNKNFWLTFVPAFILLIQYVADLFGLYLDLGVIADKLINLVNLVFMLLAILGIVNDPTTARLTDSNLALTYTEPKKDGN